MKKSDFLSLGLLGAIVLISLVNIATHTLNEYTLCLVLLIGFIIFYIKAGFRKNKNRIESDVILSILVYLAFYYLVTYIIGFFIGFNRNVYSRELIMIIKNIFPVILFIIISEILRYSINFRAKDNKILTFISFLAFVLITNTLTFADLHRSGYSDVMVVIKQLGLFILPSITTNILLTFMSIRVGYKSNIIYRLIMEIPLYILPIFPNFGDYIESVLRLSLPIVFYIWLYRYLEKKKSKKIVFSEKKHIFTLFRFNVGLLCVILVYFISGLFKYQSLVIATGSMKPSIGVGDVVIVNKKDWEKENTLRPGEVLCYRKESMVICHRIIQTVRSGQETFYVTKGDNNEVADQLLVKRSQIVGLVKYKVKYIGYPTVLLNGYR